MYNYGDPASPAPKEPFSAALTLLSAAFEGAQICDYFGFAPAPVAFLLLVVGMAYGAAAVLVMPPYSWR